MKNQSHSDKRNLLSSAGMISGLTLLSRVLGLARDSIVGSIFGASVVNDVFQIAFEIPNFLRRVIGEGALSAFIVPVFAGVRREGSEQKAWHFLNNAINVCFLITLLLTLFGLFFPQFFFYFYGGAKYLHTGQTAYWELGNRLVRIMFPFVVLLAMSSLLMGVLHAYQHFLMPAFGSIFLNLTMIAAGLFFFVENKTEMAAIFAWSVLAGAVIRAALLVPPLRARGWRWQCCLEWRDPALRELYTKMLPAFLGLAVYQFNVMISLTLANWLGEGKVSYLRFGNRVMQFPLALFAIAASTVILPQLTEFLLNKEHGKLREHVRFSARQLYLLYVPASAGLIALGTPILALLFERGAWTPQATANTQFALVLYGLGLLPLGLQRVLVPVYYAQKDTLTPVKYGACTVALNVVLCLILMRTPLDFGGLALASSISATFNTWLLYRGNKQLLGNMLDRPNLRIFAETLGSSLVMGLICYLGYRISAGRLTPDSFTIKAALTFSWIAAGVLVYSLCIALLGVPETKFIKETLWKKMRGDGQ